jgi:hypothetical protein
VIRRAFDRLSSLVARPLWAVLGFFTNTDALWRRVAVEGIVVFVGPNGSGKSLAAVLAMLPVLDGIPWTCTDTAHLHLHPYTSHADTCHVCPSRFRPRDRELESAVLRCCPDGAEILEAAGRGVRLAYSTVELLDDEQDPHPLYRPLTDYSTLITVEHADVLFDEVAGISDASDSASVPVQVVNWLHQLRKRDVRLRVTTPAYGRCSKPIRQVCTLVIDARSYFAEVADAGRLWRPRRGFIFVAYDAFAFEDFTSSTARAAGKQDKSERKLRQGRGVLWRPGCRAERTYNTLGQVLALGHVTEAGMCSVCSGTRSRPRCGCVDADLDGLAPEEIQVLETVSGATRMRRAVPLVVPHKETASRPAEILDGSHNARHRNAAALH